MAASDEDFHRILAAQMGMKYLDSIPLVSANVLKLFSAQSAVSLGCLPIALDDGKITFAISDPMDWETIDSIAFLTDCSVDSIEFAVVSSEKIAEVIARFYGKGNG